MSLKSSPFWGASAKNIHIEGLPKVYCYYIFADSPGNSFRMYPGSRSGINSLRSSTDSRCSEIKSTISFPCSRNCSEFIFADNTLELSIFYGLFATENNCSTMNWFVAPNRRFIDFIWKIAYIFICEVCNIYLITTRKSLKAKTNT